MDGRTLPRPVNYVLARVVPPEGVQIDERKRPFVIVDPRAGHGPGIGGFEAQSEIGVGFQAGHPCYFIGFLPDPVAGQTIEDSSAAEAAFLERVIALHPDADGKPTSTIEAAALCKMADRGQITGGELDGPLAFDNAISPEAARIKGIKSLVAGQAQILVVPDLEAGNMLAKNLTFLSHADAAGIAWRAGADHPHLSGRSCADPHGLLRRGCAAPPQPNG